MQSEHKRAYDRLYYHKHVKPLGRKPVTQRERYNRNRKFVTDYLACHSCSDCSEMDIVVLEFDHLRDKKSNISDLVKNNSSLQRLQEEMDKCEVVCANCHRRRTHDRRGTVK